MQNTFGTAGKSTRDMQMRRRRIIYIVMGVLTVITIAGAIFLANKQNWYRVGGWALLILIFLYLLPPIANRILKKPEKELAQFRRGAVGEEAVGALLAQLDPHIYLMMRDLLERGVIGIDYLGLLSSGNQNWLLITFL
jgi:hypothetical protein